ncbi:MAG: S-layer homology domain-containing protein [Butyricicoccus sp.]|nr:S-layer homology domain-containing protein [Butyricicoccus sp.]
MERLKKFFLTSLLTISLLVCSSAPAWAAEPANSPNQQQAVYLGVEKYGTLSAQDKNTFRHRFFIQGQVMSFTIPEDNGQYTIQNQLQEGAVYQISTQGNLLLAVQPAAYLAEGAITERTDDTITVAGQAIALPNAAVYQIVQAAGGASVRPASAADLQAGNRVRIYAENNQYRIYLTPVARPYAAPVSGTPGVKTLKNLLATALEPVGTTLYVYGGAWNWQDTGASAQATTIGLPQTWVDFFQSQSADYTYKNSANPSQSYYPHGGWNQYYYAGADCSGYIGWVIYNVMNTQSGQLGYVTSSTRMAQTFASYGWGTKTQAIRQTAFRPGDIISINGHVWMCLGTCDDGSVVILHSTPSESVNGKSGGGVQINGIGASADCQAAQLAKTYMSKYYPQWYAKYHSVFKSYASYTAYSGSVAGKFSWTIGRTLSDPDGYAALSAEDILADLFGERQAVSVSAGQGGSIQPSGIVRLPTGSSRTFVIAPQDGYEIASVVVNGTDVTDQLVNSCYTLSDVQQPHTIQATFQEGRHWFGDVSPGAFYYDAVRWATDQGITQGTTETTFSPDLPCTRAQIITFLWRAAGSPEPQTGNAFSDVSADAYFAKAAAWAAENDMVSGRIFSPNAPCTRAMAVEFMWKHAGSPSAAPASFTDISSNAVNWAVANGVTYGTSASTFSPDLTCTRGQIVTFLYRAFAK